MSRAWRIAVVEDHALQRLHTERLIEAQADLTVAYGGETFGDFMTWLGEADPDQRPHLILLDLMVDRGPSADPVMVKQVRAAGHRVLLFSAMASPPLVRRMLEAGVDGVIGKRDRESDVLAAIRAVLAGDQWVTPELATVIAQDPRRPRLSDQKERALVLYASGVPMDAVAVAIGVKKDTAKKYLQRVRNKYADAGRPIRSRLDLNRVAAQDGYLEPR